MTKEITCPYCGNIMDLRELGISRKKICFYECLKCLARSPQTWNKVTANSMAKMRERKGA